MRRLAALLVTFVLVGAAPPEDRRRYDPMSTGDMDELAERLRTHVAFLEVKVKGREDSLLTLDPRTGFGAAVDEDLVVALAHLFEDAASVTVVGPKGRLEAHVVLMDKERRVALLQTEGPLKDAGLVPVDPLPKAERENSMMVLALVSTLEHAGVVQGIMTHTGEMKEYEGHPRVDLKLHGGMPVFDQYARLVGYSRAVAWDFDKHMIVPPEKITAARTATSSAPKPEPSEPKRPKRPWWAK